MYRTLSDVSDIRSGTYAKTSKTGDGVYLQGKHFDANGSLTKALYLEVEMTAEVRKHLLKGGDVLLAAKGPRNFAALVPPDCPPAVASTTFFVISPRAEQVLPEYLLWALNSPSAQAKLRHGAKGSSIVSISKEILSKVTIPVPSLKKQRAILEIDALASREGGLRTAISDLRRKLIRQGIRNAIN